MQLERIIEDNIEAVDTMSKECNLAPTKVREVISEITPTLVSGIRETAKNETDIETFFNTVEGEGFELLLTEPEHLVDHETLIKGNEVLKNVLKSKEVSHTIAELVGKKFGVKTPTVEKIFPMVATMLMGVLIETKLETLQKGGSYKTFTKILDENKNKTLWKKVLKLDGKYFK